MNKLLLVISCLAILSISACKEKEEMKDDEPDQTTFTPTGCYLTKQTDNGLPIEYTYTDRKLISSADVIGDVTTFSHDDQDRVSEAKFDVIQAQFQYSGDNRIPDRINVIQDGDLDRFYRFQLSVDGITKMETFYADDSSKAQQIISVFYIDGKLQRVLIEAYDPGIPGYFEFAELKNIISDGKINPLAQSMATLYMNIENPFAFFPENIAEADLFVFGQASTYQASFEYNDKDYTTLADINIPGFVRELIYELDCYD